MAPRAVFLLSRIPDNKAITLFSKAAAYPHKDVRVALAASNRNLKPQDTNNVLLKLLNDEELGVRKFAIKSVSEAHNEAVHAKLKEIQARDPALPIRNIAKDKMRKLKLIDQ